MIESSGSVKISSAIFDIPLMSGLLETVLHYIFTHKAPRAWGYRCVPRHSRHKLQRKAKSLAGRMLSLNRGIRLHYKFY